METNERDKSIEQLLNAGLQQFGKAEPRMGLENRIMANLKAQPQPSPWVWWRLAPIAALLLLLAGIFLAIESRHADRAVTSNPPKHESPAMAGVGPEIQSPPVARTMAAIPTPVLAPRKTARRHNSDPPKLDQFPSPEPLNEQEEMLARYVRERPREAVMVARAREEFRKQDLAWFAEQVKQAGSDTDMQQ